MNILVCVKQVPDTTEIKIDPVTKTLMRSGVPSIVNTFDTYALEVAARIKDECGGTITILTMGPQQAEAAIRTCLGVGGDKGYLICGREFGGSDTLATSYIISTAIRYLEEKNGEKFDLIFCGKQAIDGDTGQVGPEIAEHLGLPQVTYCTEARVERDCVIATRDTDEGHDVLSVKMPALITVTKTAFEPRMSNIRAKLAATRAEIPVIDFETLKEIIDRERIGLGGSPTKVKKAYTPDIVSNCIYVEGETPSQLASNLVGMLTEAKAL